MPGRAHRLYLSDPRQSPASPVPSAATGSSSSRPKPPAVNPLTGGTVSQNPVVAVKIEDTAAGRPQVGIDKADIVYIEQAEGGLTRLLAVYNTNLPTAEPVRSTRAGDPELASQFGPIVYVASGGSHPELAPLDQSKLRSDINDRGGPGFSRDSSRPVPNNLRADLAAIAAKLKGPKAKDIGLVWSSQLVTAGSRPATSVHTRVGGRSPSTGTRSCTATSGSSTAWCSTPARQDHRHPQRRRTVPSKHRLHTRP